MTTVSFVGIGAIGFPMASRLSQVGHFVVGVDPFEAARNRAAAAGLHVAASIIEAPPAEHVIVMVATPEHFSTLVDEALSVDRDRRGERWTVMSTIGPESVREGASRLEAAGILVVDAPVTGGVSGALNGALTIFASGDPENVAVAAELLAPLGTVRAVGAHVGDGQAVKVVNQHLASVHLVAAAEALALAESLGLDKAEVLSLVGGGAAGSWMLSDRGPRMLLDSDAPVLSTIGIFVKDSGLVASAAKSSGAAVPLLDAAQARFLAAATSGLERHDDSRVIETFTTASSLAATEA